MHVDNVHILGVTAAPSIFKVIHVWLLSNGTVLSIIPHLYFSLTLLMANNSCANSLIYGRIQTRLLKLTPFFCDVEEGMHQMKLKYQRDGLLLNKISDWAGGS